MTIDPVVGCNTQRSWSTGWAAYYAKSGGNPFKSVYESIDKWWFKQGHFRWLGLSEGCSL